MNNHTQPGWIPLQALKSPHFAPNMSYLASLDPELARQLQQPCARESLLIQQREGLFCCRTNSEPPLWVFGENSPRQELIELNKQLQPFVKQNGLLVLLGCAAGYALQFLLEGFLRNPGQRILIAEPSVSRLLLALKTIDMRPALASGRLHLAALHPGIDEILLAIARYSLWGQSHFSMYASPEFPQDIPTQELAQRYAQQSAIKQQERIELVENIRERSKNQSAVTVKRVLLADFWPGSPQHLHIQSIQKALHKRGIETDLFPLEGYRFDIQGKEYHRLIVRKFLQRVCEFQPGLIVSYAYHAPHILSRDEFEALHIPWVQVVSNIAYFDRDYYPGEYTAAVERKLIPIYQKRGATRPFFLPIMANYALDRPLQTSRRDRIVFVGNSLSLNPHEIQSFHQWIRNRENLRQYIRQSETELSDFDSGLNLYDYLDGHPVPQIESDKEEYNVFRYLLCQATAARRRQLLESIADLGLVLYGNWDILPPDSPLRPCVKGMLPLRKEPEIFSDGHIFLNIHSVGHVTGANMRFFNVPGMSGFMISDGNFDEFLTPGSEYVRFATQKELMERTRYYLDHIGEAEEIRIQGLERIRSQWTYDHWVERVFSELGVCQP